MEGFSDEIRINQKYTHLYKSEYDKTLKGDSIPKINKSSLLTPDYLRRMTIGIGGDSVGILPPNCRYIEKLRQGHIVVIEEPPAFRTVTINIGFHNEVTKLKENGKLEEYGYDKDYEAKQSQKLNLAFPFVIFIFYMNKYNEISAGQAFLRVARLTGMSDYLLKIPMSNISDNQYICFGSRAGGSSQTLNAAVEKGINTFWGAEFNTDYMYNYKAYRDVAGVNTYMEWQALSQSNPMFIYNVDWIRVPMNVGQAVDEVKRHYKLSSPSNVQYKTLANMFSTPLDSGKDEAPTKRSRKKYRLFYDVAEGIFIDDNYYVHVRDPFYIKGGKQVCYINSFISFMDAGDIKYVRVEREDGRLVTFKYTKAFSKYLKAQTKQLRFEEEGILKNGVTIKESDILIMKNAIGQTVYKKVKFIRKSPEGFHEGSFGDGFYILENTEAEVFDITEPEYNGMKIDKKSKYLLVRSRNEVPFIDGGVCNFKEVDTDRYGRLNLHFAHVDTNLRRANDPYRLPLDKKSSYKVIPLDQVKELPPVFRVGRKVYVSRKRGSTLAEGTIFGTEYGVVYENGYGGIDTPNDSEIKKYMLHDDHFTLQSFDLDIDFTIGDKVVVADWLNPINMLSIKTIQGFKYDSESRDITFILSDKQGNLHQEKYYNGQTGYVFVGRIRKVTNKFGKLTAGTKIKAREAGIYHFPMKDVNIIIGFITDTGGPEPLVLCSNCCTLWYNDVVEKFAKTTMKNKKWQSMQHTPIDVAKIKYQPGDIIKGDSDYRNRSGWQVFRSRGSKTLKLIDFQYYCSYPDYFTLDRYITANSRFDCIPNPRIAPKAQREMDIVPGWPNLHGHYFSCTDSRFRFFNDERSMVNVQSSPE